MKLRLFILIWIMWCGINLLKAQNVIPKLIPELTPNTPTTAELGRFGAVPVGLFTGTAQFSIPIFELKTNNLTVPISLNYSSNGLKVDKVASWVGFDWSLEAGGVITRQINGPADDNYPLVDFPSSDILSDGTSMYNYLQPLLMGGNVENDMYNFNFCGRSGKFFFDKNGNYHCVPNGGEFRKITKTGYEITITDNNGIVYTFLPVESTFHQDQQTQNGHTVVIGWLLNNITHPYGDKISFYYSNQYVPTYPSGVSQSCTFGSQLTHLTNVSASSFIVSVCGNSMPTFLESRVPTVHLDSIVAHSTGKVIFESSSTDRLDLFGDYKLNRIKILTNDRDIVKIVNLNYDFIPALQGGNYLGNSLTGNGITYKMFLKNVMINDKNNNSISNKYSFEYNNLDALPKRLTSSQDHWGYYNGKTSNNCLLPTDLPILSSYPSLQSQITNNGFFASREPDGNYSKYGMLNKITYPTGGFTILEYEPNKIENTEYGGCRVKRTLDYKDASSVPIVKKYFYSSKNDLTNSRGNVFTNTGNYLKLFNLWSSSDQFTAENCSFTSLLSNSQFGLYMSGSYHITYPSVTISYGDNFENGGEEHDFISISDAYSTPLGYGTTGSTVLMRTSNKGWMSGTKLMETYFKKGTSGFVTLKTIEYQYDYNENRDNTNLSCLALSLSQNLQPLAYTNSQLVANYNTMVYSLYSQWLPLIAKITTTYDQNGQNAVVETESFIYENSDHKLITTKKSTLSNGKTSLQKYKYVPDYGLVTNTGCQPTDDLCLGLTNDTRPLYYLGLYKQISNPIEEQTLIYDGVSYKLLTGKLTKYKVLANNIVVPDTVLTTRLNGPSNDLTVSSLLNNSKLLFHPSYKSEVSFDKYSNQIQLSQYHKINDRCSSVIWDINGGGPIAIVTNAQINQIAYTSFEDSNYGFWQPGGGTVNSNMPAKTGKKYLDIYSANVLQYSFAIAGKYTLEYWSTSPITLSPNSLLTVRDISTSAPDANGWVFYTKEITVSAPTFLGLGATSSKIDEVKLYPTNAQMTTYTYSPLIGITSQTDPNGVTTYYEYDSFGRLKLLKDNGGNILKTYDYNYKQ